MSSMLLPIISKPARITSKTATLIDKIFTNSIHKTQLSGILYSDISDHLPIFLINNENETSAKPNNQN
jgi:hypothetical protein